MIIERNLAPYVVYGEDTVLRALEKITANQERIVFVVSEHGHLLGALTDGDFRRWLAGQDHVDLTRPCSEAANPTPRSAPASSTPAQVRPLFTAVVDHVPLLDERGHLVAIAVNRSDALQIGSHRGRPRQPRAASIAEIGINHNGSVELAKEPRRPRRRRRRRRREVPAARHVRRSTATPARAHTRARTSARSTPSTCSPGSTCPPSELFEVFDHARERGIDVMCTPWDAPSVDALVGYGVPGIKIASADLTNHDPPVGMRRPPASRSSSRRGCRPRPRSPRASTC